MLTLSTVSCIVPVKIHEEGRHDEEEEVGHGVDELSNVGRESVVLLAPVNWAGPSVEVTPHSKFMLTWFTEYFTRLQTCPLFVYLMTDLCFTPVKQFKQC